MSASHTSYRVCEPDVVHETIDGETVVVNLANGNYYSLRDIAAEIWRLAGLGATQSQIVAAIHRGYECGGAAVDADVSGLISRLVEEGLVRACPQSDVAAVAPEPTPAATARQPYRAPALEAHSDMQDLLLLDPIHDTDDSGWPHGAGGKSD